MIRFLITIYGCQFALSHRFVSLRKTNLLDYIYTLFARTHIIIIVIIIYNSLIFHIRAALETITTYININFFICTAVNIVTSD